MEDMYEANKTMLKSMLLDEERLITYVSLSKDLCVHVNNSKLLLLRIVDTVRQERPDLQLNVNYIISGATDDSNARTIICSEQELNKEKSSFKIIFFEHIYSVSKGRPIIDTAAYVTVNKFEDFALCSGLIKSNHCDKRTSLEICNLKSNSQENVVHENIKSLPLKKTKQEANPVKNGFAVIKDISKIKDNQSKSEATIKQEKISPKKEPTSSNQPKVNAINGNKSQKGIAGFFNKTSNNKNEIKDKIQNVNEVKVEKEKTVKLEKMDVEESTVLKIENQDKKKDNSNKCLNQIKKNAKVDKKRKRVLNVSDSDSDNENNPFVDNSVTEQEQVDINESDGMGWKDEIPPTPTTNNIKITSGIVNPKKKRKVIDKTYTDEDGYILTKKEEIYESCSDNEEQSKIQEKPRVNQVKTETSPKGKTGGSKKKVSPPQKGKQPTLTNFFKRI